MEVTTIHKKRVRVDLRDEFIGPALYLQGEIDTHLLEIMRFLDLRGSVCLDIGANLGLFALAMSDLVGSCGRIYAFEPESHNFELLTYNLKNNDASNVIPLQVAVGDSVGECKLALANHNFGDHQVLTSGDDGRSVQVVRMTTIDEILKDLPDGVVKLIKIDIQGYEYHAVKGMTQTIRRNPDAVLLVEVGPGRLRNAGSSVTELLRLFGSLGLKGCEFHDYRIAPIAEPWIYELFPGVREEDFILCQNPKIIISALRGYYGKSLPEEFLGDR
jgi:FkbM family methyltransferase